MKITSKGRIILLMLISCVCSSACTYTAVTNTDCTVSPVVSDEMEETGTWKAGKQIYSGKFCKIVRSDVKDNYIYKVFNKKGENVYTEEITTIVEPTVHITDEAVDIHYGAGTGIYFDKLISLDGKFQSEWMNSARLIGKKYVVYMDFDKEAPTKTQLRLEEIYSKDVQKIYSFPCLADEWDVEKYEFQNNEQELFIQYIDKDTKEEKEMVISLSKFR